VPQKDNYKLHLLSLHSEGDLQASLALQAIAHSLGFRV